MAEHSELSASSCARWWNCPGSVALTRGIETPTSVYADEGTLAHAIAERALRRGTAGLTYSQEMLETLEVYLDLCRDLMSRCTWHEIEKQFSLEYLGPPVPMFGTADFVAYFAETKTLHVVDLKYGKGVKVEAEGNLQLAYYALGASLDTLCPVHEVVATIVQPRMDPPISEWRLNLFDLGDFASALMKRAAATRAPNAPLQPGDWCRFCPAAGTCPARAEDALRVAQIEFADAVSPQAPPEIRLLSPEQIGAILGQANKLEDWLKDLRKAALEAALRGEEIPGWKVVAANTNRRWRDKEHASIDLALWTNLPRTRFEVTDVVSPAKAEEIMAFTLDEPTKKANLALAKEKLAHLVERPPGAPTLAPVSDTRPALPTSGNEFLALSEPSDWDT